MSRRDMPLFRLCSSPVLSFILNFLKRSVLCCSTVALSGCVKWSRRLVTGHYCTVRAQNAKRAITYIHTYIRKSWVLSLVFRLCSFVLLWLVELWRLQGCFSHCALLGVLYTYQIVSFNLKNKQKHFGGSILKSEFVLVDDSKCHKLSSKMFCLKS